MITIQNDTVDLMAREITPQIVKLAHQMLPVLEPKYKKNAEYIIGRLEHWYGSMDENSEVASMYASWQYFFYKTLLYEQIPDSKMRFSLVTNYPFLDFFQRLIHTLVEEPENERMNSICKGAFPEYKGKRHCMYNIARSMSEAYEFLHDKVSPNTQDW